MSFRVPYCYRFVEQLWICLLVNRDGNRQLYTRLNQCGRFRERRGKISKPEEHDPQGEREQALIRAADELD